MPRETKWTPGPWRYDVQDGEVNGRPDASVLVTDLDVSSSVDDDDERDANGRLIAAAPDLYEALRTLAHEAHGFLAMADRETHGNTNIQVLSMRIKEALECCAKARGEA